MATTTKVMARTAAATSSTTLYTVPSLTTAVVTNIAVANTGATNATYSILMNGIELIGTATVSGNSTVFVDLKQVLSASQVIAGFASNTGVKFHISGVEIA